MGKDYKIGLMCGLVAAVAFVIWLATRPSLSTRARMLGPAPASTQGSQPGSAAANSVEQPNRNGRGRSQSAKTAQPTAANNRWQQQLLGEPSPAEPQRQETHRVEEQAGTVPRQTETAPPVRTHIVRSGESLSAISQQYYGTPDAWQRIAKANEGRIKDANKITVGTQLIIP